MVEQAAGSGPRLGHRGPVLLKTDNAPALVDLKQGEADACANASGVDNLQVVLEHPPAYKPQATGSVGTVVKQ
eukprot:5297635-Alexandrium_andersonii.AAC.1